MKLAARAAIIGFAAALSGCPWYWHAPHHHHDDRDDLYVPMPVTNLAERLVKGDVVRIRTQEGKVHRFRVNAVEADAFTGVAVNEKTYRVPYPTIAEIWIRRL